MTVHHRAIILTSSSSPYVPVILAGLLKTSSSHIAAIVTVEDSEEKSGWAKIVTVAQRAGWRYALLKLLLFGRIKLQQMIGLYPTIQSICHEYNIDRIVLSSIKSETTVKTIRGLQPDILFSILFEKIIPPEIIAIPSVAALNLHPAPLPRYAGVAPIFWVLSNNERGTAVTIHYLNREIDAGDIALQRDVHINARESVHALYLQCCHVAAALLVEAIASSSSEFPRTQQRLEERTYFSQPTKESYRQLRRHGFSLLSFRDFLSPLSTF